MYVSGRFIRGSLLERYSALEGEVRGLVWGRESYWARIMVVTSNRTCRQNLGQRDSRLADVDFSLARVT